MDYRERFSDATETFRAALDGDRAQLWTALPGIIVAFDAAKQTASVRPALQARIRQPDGNFIWKALPVCPDVPVYFPAGGGYTLTFPVKPDDECLLVFASRCIDLWWQSGGSQKLFDARMHDLSDGFAFVGVRSKPRFLSAPSTTSTQLRADDASLFVDVNSATGVVTAKAPTQIILDTPQVTITGRISVNNAAGSPQAMNVNGVLAASTDVLAGTVSLHGHQHQNSGGSGTGGPPVVP